MKFDTKLLEKFEDIKAKIKKQKLNNTAEIDKYSKLFDEYSRLSKIIFKTR